MTLLRDWFGRFTGQPAVSFWKYHFQMYRKRPVYWPLQSPGKKFTVWLFHERLTGDTLYSLRNAVVEQRLRLAEGRIEELRPVAERDRSARQELERTRDLADDLRAFSANIKAITDRGYTPHIDDGVLLNAAPLFTLLPSWGETKKAWESLGNGDFDWAHQAMDHYYRQYDLTWSDKGFDTAWAGRENWLICQGDRLLGFVSLSRDDHALYIRELHILDALRCQGAGSWVLEQMFARTCRS